MNARPNGELVPIGGGDPIPLIRANMKLGRRESCDVCLKFPNISGEHCELNFLGGIWQVVDLGSTNGTKVNGMRVQKKKLRPGDEIAIASRRFKIQYELTALPGALDDSVEEDIKNVSLLEKAGLIHKRDEDDEPRPPRKGR